MWTQEDLKRRLVALNPHFYLVDSRTPGATYKVLWYRVSGAQSPTPSNYPSTSMWRSNFSISRQEVKIKVDILLPGVMDIPLFPTNKIVHKMGLPAAPLDLLILLKLQAWSQHRASLETRFREKQYVDHRDLQEMLPIAHRQKIRVALQPPADSYLSPTFISNTMIRVREHVAMYPRCAEDWARIGFDVQPPEIQTMPPSKPKPKATTKPSPRLVFGQKKQPGIASYYAYRDQQVSFGWDS